MEAVDGAWYVVEQRGKFWYCVGSEKTALVMDISERLGTANEEGLLCVVKSPDFDLDQHIYIYYSDKSPRRSVISRFTLKNHRIDLKSEEQILVIPEPYGNHNGGQLAFGPDNMLYVGVGDGGSAGDPKKYGQDLKNVHGSILRLDVLGHKTYQIPPDNPYANSEGGEKAEIYAWGLRNPWRFSFDRVTGELWCADVGQNRFEEINIISSGANYGWNLREGYEPYVYVRRKKKNRKNKTISTPQKKVDAAKLEGDFVDPIFVYPVKTVFLLQVDMYTVGTVFLI